MTTSITKEAVSLSKIFAEKVIANNGRAEPQEYLLLLFQALLLGNKAGYKDHETARSANSSPASFIRQLRRWQDNEPPAPHPALTASLARFVEKRACELEQTF